MNNHMTGNSIRKKILVADDDPSIVDAIQLMLELYDYDVTTTVDGETIYKMEKDYPDLLLLDIWMSGQDGREICKYLKNNPLTKNIPIIMISASRDIVESAKDAGADDFIAKPFQMDELLKKVEKHTSA
jgi:CheY-like chemotaxis protein